ncbi:MAG: hypothetical protein AAFV93_01030 [Chloroflexota bacterium]
MEEKLKHKNELGLVRQFPLLMSSSIVVIINSIATIDIGVSIRFFGTFVFSVWLAVALINMAMCWHYKKLVIMALVTLCSAPVLWGFILDLMFALT